MSVQHPLDQLGRRERQIMDILFRTGRATASEVQVALGEPLSNSAVRGMLRHLASKGYVAHEQDGPRYVYFPTADRGRVSKSALENFVRTFFDDSASAAVAAMVGMYEKDLTNEALDELEAVVERARKKGVRR